MDDTELAYTASNPSYVKTTNDGKIAYEYMLPKTPAYLTAGIHHIHIVTQYPANECSNTATQDIRHNFKVIDLPDVKFSISKADCQNIFNVVDETPLPKNIRQRVWNFGDPLDPEHNTATTPTVKHSYTRNGTYAITLNIISTSGCVATTTHYVLVNNNTPINFDAPPMSCINKPLQFSYLPLANLKPVMWKWYFGDGDSTINNQNQQVYHNYKTAGVYQARLIIVNETGCLNYSEFKPINITAPPIGDFDFQDICSGNEAKFTFKGIPDNGEQISWNFGDNHSTSQNPDVATSVQANHIYTFPGEYEVGMTISLPGGCETKIIKTIHVHSTAVTPDFLVENKCAGQALSFKNTSTIAGYGNIDKIEWYFEPESNPNQKETHIYPDLTGPYFHTFPLATASPDKMVTVKLRVYTPGDCFYEVSKSFKLFGTPNVSFRQMHDICENAAPVQLTEGEETTGIEGHGYYSGDGVVADTFFDPAKAGVGVHQLTYNFITSDGCPNFASGQFTVLSTPQLRMPSDITILEGQSVTLKPVISGSINNTFKWQPSTGLSDAGISNPIAKPTQDITYTLTVSNGICDNQSSLSIRVLKAIKPVNTFTPNADGINDIWTIENIEDYPQAVIQIFNRYGIELYRSTGYARPWNGKYRGQDVPSGVYYYIITPKKNQSKISGALTV